MAEQDGREPCEEKPKPLLPIPSRPGTYYGRMYEFVGSFRTTGLGRKVKGALEPFQWLDGANWFGPLEGCSFKTSFGNDQCHLCCSRKDWSSPSRVMSVARLPVKDSSSGLKRAKMDIQWILGFSDDDKIGTIQPYDDALVVTLRIGGYDVKRVLIN